MYWTFINFIVPSNPWIAQHYQFHHCLFCTVVLCHRVELNLEMGHWIRTQFIVPIVFLSELFVIVEIIKSVVFFVWTRSSFWIWKNCFSANVVMSTAVVPSRVGNPFPQKKKTMKLFHHLLSDMKHQRVAVIALALGQAVNIYDSRDFWLLLRTKGEQFFISIFPTIYAFDIVCRHWRIVHCFWCVLGWFMPNKYHDCWLSIAWIRKNARNIMKHRRHMAYRPTTFDSWRLISSLTTHWLFCIALLPLPRLMHYALWDC